MIHKKNKEPSPEKEALAVIQRVSFQLSLGKIPTVKDLLDKLGGEPWCSDYPPLESRPDFSLFAKIKPKVLARLKANLEDNLKLDTLYTTEDWEIESQAWEGYLDRKLAKLYQHPWDDKEHYEGWIPPDNAKQKAKCRYFQEQAAREIFYKATVLKYPALLLRAEGGQGKTFCFGRVLRWFKDTEFAEKRGSISPYKYLIVTKASIKFQTDEVIVDKFGFVPIIDDLLVTNYDQLRAALGDELIRETVSTVDGEIVKSVFWRPMLHPQVVIWDECQALKNEDSQQTKLALAINKLQNPVFQLFSSASPFARIISTKNFCIATRHKIKTPFGEQELNEDNFMQWASKFCSDGCTVYDWDKKGMKRLLKEMSEYIVTFKNVRQEYKETNCIRLIDFPSIESRKRYDSYFEEWLKRRQEIEQKNLANSSFLQLVADMKFQQGAEIERAPVFARLMYEAANNENLAPICACKFKGTIAKTVDILHKDFNVSRKEISLIWGGGAEFTQNGRKYTKEEIKDIYQRAFRGEDIDKKTLKDITAQLTAQINGLTDIDPSLELGIQNHKQRWQEIKRFQNGQSKYCFFTFGAGGAGLSLHHEYPHTRPRWTLISPTYNEMDLYQAMKRAPRLTSLSPTEQVVLLFKGTIEEAVLARVTAKTNVLQAVLDHGKEFEKEAKELTRQMEKRSDTEEDEDEDKGEELFKEIEEGE